MAKSKLKPSVEDSFAVGRLVGQKEAFEEMAEMMSGEFSISGAKIYLKARLKTLNTQITKDPFKTKGE